MVDVSFWIFLIACPLCMLGGFVDSIAGGGGLITLPTFLAVGLPSHIAIGTNKIQSTLGTAVSTIRYFLQGYVNLKIGITCAIMAILGSLLGSSLVLYVDDWTLKVVLVILLPFTAIFVLWDKGIQKTREEFGFAKTLIISAAIALIIGLYDGFYGPGTGTFLILLYSVLAHMTIEKSNGITKITNLASNVAAAVVFLFNGVPYVVLGLAAGIFNAFGNYIGSKLFINKGIKIVKPIMIFVLILLFAKVLYDMFI